MLFLLGLKEHLGAVWIGFGCYFLLNTPHRRLGIALILLGATAIYLILYQWMPYFRDYQPSWSLPLGPLDNLPQKGIYLVKILLPFLFLPLLGWNYGILAAPAIGINLLGSAERTGMYSTIYHYDDVPATLLFLSIILIAKYKSSLVIAWKRRLQNKRWQLVGLIWWIGILLLLPSSPLRITRDKFPQSDHWQIKQEIEQFAQMSQGAAIHVQNALGTHFNRREISMLAMNEQDSCSKLPDSSVNSLGNSHYLVMHPELNHYLLLNLQACLQELAENPNYQRLTQYPNLYIYKNLRITKDNH